MEIKDLAQLPKLYVVGSIPTTRSKLPLELLGFIALPLISAFPAFLARSSGLFASGSRQQP